ncbi:MAG: DUF167 domain-containing protein [Nanoarchaeota archaeon]|nr:DUF167 domain-containing protein [Nanoarchaeota archaeon]
MKLKIKVHTNSSTDKIEKISDKSYEIWTKEKPIDGKANKHLEKELKKYFKKECKIIHGLKSNYKIVDVLGLID